MSGKSEKLRVGLLGTGSIASSHAEAVSLSDRFVITAVCDTNRERMLKFSSSLGALRDLRLFDDIGSFFEAGKDAADIAVIALPHFLHCEAAIRAFEAGMHVIVEKPMAINTSQCREMMTAAMLGKKALIVAEPRNYDPGAALTGSRFAAGKLGRFLAGSHINIRQYFGENRPGWFLDAEKSGGGMFINVGMHRLAITRTCLRNLEPSLVFASVAMDGLHSVEACTSAIVKYRDSGAFIYEESGYFPKTAWLGTGFHFIFSEGIVTYDENSWHIVKSDGRQVEEKLERNMQQYLPVYKHMQSLLEAGRSSLPDLPEAWCSAGDVAIAEAAYKSGFDGETAADLRGPDYIVNEEFRKGYALE